MSERVFFATMDRNLRNREDEYHVGLKGYVQLKERPGGSFVCTVWLPQWRKHILTVGHDRRAVLGSAMEQAQAFLAERKVK